MIDWVHDQQLREAVEDFLKRFEGVFHYDWEYSLDCLSDRSRRDYIDPGGTFLRPYPSMRYELEANNWGNRGALLHSYRALRKLVPSREEEFHPGPMQENYFDWLIDEE